MSVSLIVHLNPRSSANRIKAWENGRLLVSVTAPPRGRCRKQGSGGISLLLIGLQKIGFANSQRGN